MGWPLGGLRRGAPVVVALGAAVDPRVIIRREGAACPKIAERIEGFPELVGVAEAQGLIGEEVGISGERVGERDDTGKGI